MHEGIQPSGRVPYRIFGVSVTETHAGVAQRQLQTGPLTASTDGHENTLQDVITKIEPDLSKTATGLTIEDFNLLVSLNVFDSGQMNQAFFTLRCYEDASLSYTSIDSHAGLRHYCLYDTVVAKDAS